MPGSWLFKRIQETLELPAPPATTSFAIAGFAESFYSRRYREPEWLATVEWLCWLDVQLIEARSDAFLDTRGEQPDNYFRFPVFSRLITMYSAEGYLREALEVVERAERFGQGGDHREKLLVRIANVEAEDEQ